MSQSSPRAEAASKAQWTAASLQKQLTDISYPEIASLLSRISADTAGGFNALPQSVTDTFAPIFTGVNASYDTAESQLGGILGQKAKQAGMPLGAGQLADTTLSAARGLETDRAQALKTLKFQRAQAGLTQYTGLIEALGGGARTALSLGSGGLGLETGAAGAMSGESQFDSAFGGMATGASIGSAINPGWGTLIGGAAGGIYGALSGG